jgi:hypothetical protein
MLGSGIGSELISTDLGGPKIYSLMDSDTEKPGLEYLCTLPF